MAEFSLSCVALKLSTVPYIHIQAFRSVCASNRRPSRCCCRSLCILLVVVSTQDSRMNMNGGQDWDSVVIRKKKPTNSQLKDEAAVNAARRAGVGVETVKKTTHVQTTSGKAAHKLEAETEDFHQEKVSTELKKQIVQARTAKKLTQAQLAQLINEKPQTIQEYESGKAIPNPQILGKMSRVLGVTLRKATK